ncbi:UDP-N-acetylmuramate--L-alanine ligase [Prolixibacteraceae bacterium JC049]|nr:UDP-N-acetylmuramate--L-alanine ligase [Prolixibacteraceae bacterium JC049]
MKNRLENIKHVYLLGIGGIGMSALARYFKLNGCEVAGYDRTPSDITNQLTDLGIAIHFEDNIELFPGSWTLENTLIIVTPAIPADLKELNELKSRGFELLKRSQVLGLLTRDKTGIAVAGTHGKTSVSTMCGHIMHRSKQGCSAFLGGIANNYNSNLLLSENDSENVVVEADEFDRSFLQLYPHYAAITSMDADHLDIYETHENLLEAFHQFIQQIDAGGVLINKKGLPVDKSRNQEITYRTYSLKEEADYYTQNLQITEDGFTFDLVTPNGRIENLNLPYPGWINVENSVVASALALEAGVGEEELRAALTDYQGVKRRFQLKLKNEKHVLIDDYAHHPEELRVTITSVKEMYAGRKVTGVFQPHLYSRTNDFAVEFAESLSLLDELILLDIYPARELPMEGVTSEIIFDKVKLLKKQLIVKEQLTDVINNGDWDVVLMMGAGDIDRLVAPVKTILENSDKDVE